ncbi:uncharacterized protein [Argopecten irradians]|uniref:uncharacterized protein n=1 Tax=Argopecten irradians TaxID=31199 RepID=UPI0037141508
MAERYFSGSGLYVQLSSYRGITYVHINGGNGRCASMSAPEYLDLANNYNVLAEVKKRMDQELSKPTTKATTTTPPQAPQTVVPQAPVPQAVQMKRKRDDEEEVTKRRRVASPTPSPTSSNTVVSFNLPRLSL